MPACGLGQGSKAAPAAWMQLSSIFVQILSQKGFGALLSDPVTKAFIQSIGCIFVDDTDLYVFIERMYSALAVLRTAQRAITLWSSLLSATGGAIKTEKSFWCMLDYTCINGVWQYAKFQHYPLTFSLEGEETLVPQHAVTEADKTLGVFHCPMGGHAEHIKYMRRQALEWLSQMKNGRLPPALIWRSYRTQLRARLKYALGTLTNSLADAESCLGDLEFTLLPLLNVNRHIRTGWRRLHQSFGGIGLLHLPTEQLICRLNILQQHYGTSSTVGKKLSCSLHWLQVQLGHDDNPLLLDYARWNHLTCRTWWVELWQSLQNSPVHLSLIYNRLLPPRQFDCTIMTFLMNQNLPNDTLLRMNKCRNFLHALHLSDIATADGKYIDQTFLLTHNPQPLISTLSFPREHPTKADWLMWGTTWKSLTSPIYKLRTSLGPWINQPTIKWRWFHDASSDHVLLDAEDITHVYSCQSTSNTWSGNKYSYLHSTRTSATGVPITIATTLSSCSEPILNIVSQSPNAIISPTNKPTTFWDALISGGSNWMWSKFHFTNEQDTSVEWIIQGLAKDSLLWVTDGSHFAQRGPFVSGAAWVVTDCHTNQTLACSFAEISPAASSYRAEALGLYSVHAFIHALSLHHSLQTGATDIHCDNEAALDEIK